MTDITIVTTPAFDRRADKLLTPAALEELYDHLEKFPEEGDIIRGTGGVRKLRWKAGNNNKGKSGGVRVLYHFSDGMLILLITLYSKSEKENISDKERNELKKKIPSLIALYGGKNAKN